MEMMKSKIGQVGDRSNIPARMGLGRRPAGLAAGRSQRGATKPNPAPERSGQGFSARSAFTHEEQMEPRGASEPSRIESAPELDLDEKIRAVLVLAKEQGHLTHDDILDTVGEGKDTPQNLD